MSVCPPESQDGDELSPIFNWVRKAHAEGKKIMLLEGTANAIVFTETNLSKVNVQKHGDDVSDSEAFFSIKPTINHVKIKGNTINNGNFTFNINMNILSVIKAAGKSVPYLKYAVGLTGVAALLALVKLYGLGWNVAFWGGIVVLFLMTVLFLLSKAVTPKTHPFHRPAFMMVCGMGILFFLTAGFLFSCTFFDKPKRIKEIIYIGSAFTDPAQKESNQTIDSASVPNISN